MVRPSWISGLALVLGGCCFGGSVPPPMETMTVCTEPDSDGVCPQPLAIGGMSPDTALPMTTGAISMYASIRMQTVEPGLSIGVSQYPPDDRNALPTWTGDVEAPCTAGPWGDASGLVAVHLPMPPTGWTSGLYVVGLYRNHTTTGHSLWFRVP